MRLFRYAGRPDLRVWLARPSPDLPEVASRGNMPPAFPGPAFRPGAMPPRLRGRHTRARLHGDWWPAGPVPLQIRSRPRGRENPARVRTHDKSRRYRQPNPVHRPLPPPKPIAAVPDTPLDARAGVP